MADAENEKPKEESEQESGKKVEEQKEPSSPQEAPKAEETQASSGEGQDQKKEEKEVPAPAEEKESSKDGSQAEEKKSDEGQKEDVGTILKTILKKEDEKTAQKEEGKKAPQAAAEETKEKEPEKKPESIPKQKIIEILETLKAKPGDTLTPSEVEAAVIPLLKQKANLEVDLSKSEAVKKLDEVLKKHKTEEKQSS